MPDHVEFVGGIAEAREKIRQIVRREEKGAVQRDAGIDSVRPRPFHADCRGRTVDQLTCVRGRQVLGKLPTVPKIDLRLLIDRQHAVCRSGPIPLGIQGVVVGEDDTGERDQRIAKRVEIDGQLRGVGVAGARAVFQYQLVCIFALPDPQYSVARRIEIGIFQQTRRQLRFRRQFEEQGGRAGVHGHRQRLRGVSNNWDVVRVAVAPVAELVGKPLLLVEPVPVVDQSHPRGVVERCHGHFGIRISQCQRGIQQALEHAILSTVNIGAVVPENLGCIEQATRGDAQLVSRCPFEPESVRQDALRSQVKPEQSAGRIFLGSAGAVGGIIDHFLVLGRIAGNECGSRADRGAVVGQAQVVGRSQHRGDKLRRNGPEQVVPNVFSLLRSPRGQAVNQIVCKRRVHQPEAVFQELTRQAAILRAAILFFGPVGGMAVLGVAIGVGQQHFFAVFRIFRIAGQVRHHPQRCHVLGIRLVGAADFFEGRHVLGIVAGEHPLPVRASPWRWNIQRLRDPRIALGAKFFKRLLRLLVCLQLHLELFDVLFVPKGAGVADAHPCRAGDFGMPVCIGCRRRGYVLRVKGNAVFLRPSCASGERYDGGQREAAPVIYRHVLDECIWYARKLLANALCAKARVTGGR